MSRAVIIVLALIAAFAAGTSSASYLVSNWLNLAGQHSGPWQRLTTLGATNTDPYSRVFQHMSRQLPMSNAEGRVYVARYDDDNQPLDPKCSYSIEGDIPAARLFTLRAETIDGQLIIAQAPFQSAIHSDQMLFIGTRFAVSVSALTQPNNWLALKTTEPFKLILSYYDVAVINHDTGNSTSLPRVKKGSCTNV